MNYFRHFFLPHHTNNQRARLLHHDIVLVFASIFFLATFFLSGITSQRPDILGITFNISIQDLLLLTNTVRQQNNLLPLTYNAQLASAAYAKGQNMFTYNYWAHINPTTGQTPWVFIQNAGYQYTYAGENLARGFTTAQDAMTAWLASPTHRANILSPNYQEVGFAVEEGVLTGEKDTVLIVEEFGGKGTVPLKKTAKPVSGLPQPVVLAQASMQQQNSSFATNPIIDRYSFAKNIAQYLLLLFIIIFILDIILIEKKRITRIVGHNLDHILFLFGVLLFIIFMSTGAIQ